MNISKNGLVNFNDVKSCIEYVYAKFGEEYADGDMIRLCVLEDGGVSISLVPSLFIDYTSTYNTIYYRGEDVRSCFKSLIDLLVVSCAECLDIYPDYSEKKHMVAEVIRGPKAEDMRNPGVVIGKRKEGYKANKEDYFLSMVEDMFWNGSNPNCVGSMLAKKFYFRDSESSFSLNSIVDGKGNEDGYFMYITVNDDCHAFLFDRDLNLISEEVKDETKTKKVISDMSGKDLTASLIRVLGKFDSLPLEEKGLISELHITKSKGSTPRNNIVFTDTKSKFEKGRNYTFSIG